MTKMARETEKRGPQYFHIYLRMAYVMTEMYNRLLKSSFGEAFYVKNVYIYGMIATFISCIYSCTIYLESYIQANDEKSRLLASKRPTGIIKTQSHICKLKEVASSVPVIFTTASTTC